MPVPHHNAVCNVADKFQETQSVDDTKCDGRPAKLSEEKLLDTSDSMQSKKNITKVKAAARYLSWNCS